MKKIALFIVIGFLGISAQAQQPLSLTIDQAVEIGLQNSKALRSSQYKVIAAEAKSGEMNALGLPSLKFQGAYARLSDVPPGAFQIPAGIFGTLPAPFNVSLPPADVNSVISPSISNNYTLKATVQQPLFTGWKISGAQDAAEYSAEAVKLDFQKDRADVIYNIKAAYWNVYRALEFKKFVDENVEQIRAHATDAENLLKQGMITTNDLLKVQVQLSDARVRQIDAKNNVRLAMYALNNTLGLPLTNEITLTSTININERNWTSLDSLVTKAMNDRPDMLAMNSRIRAGESGLTSARGSWWPQIYFIGNYNYLRPNQRYFPMKDEFKGTWDVAVSVSFDIWNWNQTGNQTTQAQAQLSQAEEGLSMLKDGVMLDVTQNYLAVNQSKERKAVAEQGVAQAEENYRVMHEKYKKGLTPNSELLDAEVALLQAKLNLTQSLVDYELSVARLARAIGE